MDPKQSRLIAEAYKVGLLRPYATYRHPREKGRAYFGPAYD